MSGYPYYPEGVPTILTGWHAEGSLNSSATCKLKNWMCGRNHLGTKELLGIAGKSCRQSKHLHFTTAVCLFYIDISTYALVTRDITCCWLAASLNQFGGRAPRRSETSARRDWTIWRAGGLEKARNGDVERGARRQLANDRFATHIETRQWKPSWPDQIKFGVCYKWNGTGHFRIIAGQGRLK